MKRTLVTTTLLLILHGAACPAAEPPRPAVRFAATVWNFGSVREFGGSVSHSFRFINKGGVPLVIESTRTTCGCVTPRYSRSPILPGAEGEVHILFDPANRPGAFSKTMSVKFSGIDKPVTLTVHGTVTPETRSTDDQYPFPAGQGFRITHQALNFGQTQQGASRSFSIGYVNASDKEASFALRTKPSVPWLRITGGGRTKPGESGSVTASCTIDGDTIFGRRSCRLAVVIDGETTGGAISVTVLATDDFSQASSDKYPRLESDAAHFEFGTIGPNKPAEHTFRLTNSGNQPLVIRNTSASAGVTILPGTAHTLAPGATTSLRCRITSSSQGRFTGVVTLVTNAPTQTVQHLRLTADIRK